MIALIAIGGGIALVLRSRSAPAPLSTVAPPGAADYQRLSDSTIRACPPPVSSPLAAFDACLLRYRDGLSSVASPASVETATVDARNLIKQLLTCRSSQLHEDETMRDWPPGCPQPGPATVTAADDEDRAFRRDYFRILLGVDATIRTALGLPAGAAPSLGG